MYREFANTMIDDKHNESQRAELRFISYLFAIVRVLCGHPLFSPLPPVQFLPREPQLSACAGSSPQWRTRNLKTMPTWPRKTRGQHDQVDQHDQVQIGRG